MSPKALIKFSDLSRLEPLVADTFPLEGYGISQEVAETAFHRLPDSGIDAADSGNCYCPSRIDIFCSQVVVLDALLWHLVYRLCPDAYVEFAAAEIMPLQSLLPSLSLSEGRALDLACGGGRLIDHWRDRARSIVGVDISSELIEYCRTKYSTRPEIEIQQGTFRCIPCADATFDVVGSCLAFPTNAAAGGAMEITEMLRVLKQGGCIVILTTHAAVAERLAGLRFRVERVEAALSLETRRISHPVAMLIALLSFGDLPLAKLCATAPWHAYSNPTPDIFIDEVKVRREFAAFTPKPIAVYRAILNAEG